MRANAWFWLPLLLGSLTMTACSTASVVAAKERNQFHQLPAFAKDKTPMTDFLTPLQTIDREFETRLQTIDSALDTFLKSAPTKPTT